MTEKKEETPSIHCAENCPFLEINYLEAIEKIPYHCNLFDAFLAFDGKVLRCSECLGQQKSIREEGLNFINAYRGTQLNRSATKAGFAKLFPSLQKQFVFFLKKFGKPVGIPTDLKLNMDQLQETLFSQLSKEMQQIKQQTPDNEELKLLLKKQSDDFPELLDSKICKFLQNLFSVLDSSDREILMQILRNKHTFVQFLQKLKFMPKSGNFLNSIRIELQELLPEAKLENASIIATIPPERIYEPKIKT